MARSVQITRLTGAQRERYKMGTVVHRGRGCNDPIFTVSEGTDDKEAIICE